MNVASVNCVLPHEKKRSNSTNRPTTLCIFEVEGPDRTKIVQGAKPEAYFSHDTNMFYLAQEVLRLGCQVAFRHKWTRELIEVSRVYPLVDVLSFDPDEIMQVDRVYVFSQNPAFFQDNKRRIPAGIPVFGVLLVAATRWLETPEHFPPSFVDDLREAVVYDIDCAIVQNVEMGDLFRSLAVLVGARFDPERILIAPCGFPPEEEGQLRRMESRRVQIRAEMDVYNSDIVIINSGGVWKWTDLDVFLDAFIDFHRERPGNPTVFFVMGLRQDSNPDHQSYIDSFIAKIQANADLIELGRLRVVWDWNDASKLLPRYNFGADVGLNVSKASIEQAQSFRQRFVDYVKASLPVINTLGDPMSRSGFRDMMIVVEPGKKESYLCALRQICDQPHLLHSARDRAVALRGTLRTDKVYLPVLRTLFDLAPVDRQAREAVIRTYSGLASFSETYARRSGLPAAAGGVATNQVEQIKAEVTAQGNQAADDRKLQRGSARHLEVCFLYNELPDDIETRQGHQFTGALSVDAHLDTVFHGILRYVPDASVYLVDKRNPDAVFLQDESGIRRVDLPRDGAGCLTRFDYVFISPYAIHSIDAMLSQYSIARIVVSMPAVWWYEHPDLYPYSLLEKNIQDFKRLNAAFIAPNERICDYLSRFAMLTTGTDISDRIINLPYFIRDFYDRLPDQDLKIIIDSGGPWRWTANHIFAQAFVDYCNRNPGTKIRFVFSLKDSSNPDHEAYQSELLRIFGQLRDPSKVVILQWSEKERLKHYLTVASYGLSVNLNTIEGYLSSRVRLRDYLSYRLPVITTGENIFYEQNREICLCVEPTPQSFLDLFAQIENTAEPVQARRFDDAGYGRKYEAAIHQMVAALERAPSGVAKMLKTDTKIDIHDLMRGHAAVDAAKILRRFAYQLSREQMIAFVKEICGDQRLRNILSADELRPHFAQLMKADELRPHIGQLVKAGGPEILEVVRVEVVQEGNKATPPPPSRTTPSGSNFGQSIETLGQLLALEDKDFIQAAYEKILRRSPDMDGLKLYMRRLAGGKSRRSVLYALRHSQEGMAQLTCSGPYERSSEMFLDDLYWRLLGRPADEAGKAYYLARLRRQGQRYRVVRDICLSPEARKHNSLDAQIEIFLLGARERRRLYGWFARLFGF